jgi:4-amino-4-deoxy-L-arabinose transferase-like glycosyltransferase
MTHSMQPKYLSLLFICLLSFTAIFQSSLKHDLPLSWDVWYHLRISRQFSQGEFRWDSGSFGPEGRAHTYPPLFHSMTAVLHTLTHIELETLARIIPPFIYAFAILSFYILVKGIFGERTALLSCFFAAVSPLLLDRGLSYTPEALSFIFFNLGLYAFWKGKWKETGILGGMLFLTHGLTSTAFLFVIVFYTFWAFLILRENYWSRLFLTVSVSFLVSLGWLLQGIPTFVPRGFSYPLNLYPGKLGWIQMLFAFFGLIYLSKDRKSVFVISFAGSLFLLSQFSLSLPYRFTEFLIFPVCILAGLAANEISMKFLHSEKGSALTLMVLFLLSFAQGYWYVEKYSPVVTSEEIAAFRWINQSSVKGYTIMCEWRTAPILAYFSRRAPVKGAYQFGSSNLTERTEDTTLFYTEYPDFILEKYDVSLVYYGSEEKNQYTEPPFNKIYSTQQTGVYYQ